MTKARSWQHFPLGGDGLKADLIRHEGRVQLPQPAPVFRELDLSQVVQLTRSFHFSISHIPRESNTEANSLASAAVRKPFL